MSASATGRNAPACLAILDIKKSAGSDREAVAERWRRNAAGGAHLWGGPLRFSVGFGALSILWYSWYFVAAIVAARRIAQKRRRRGRRMEDTFDPRTAALGFAAELEEAVMS